LVHDEFEAYLAEPVVRPEFVSAVLQAVVDAWMSRRQQEAVKKKERCNETARLQAALNELISLRTSRLLTDEEFISQRERLRGELTELQDDVHQDDRVTPLEPEDSRIFMKWMSDLGSLWAVLPVEGRHAFVTSVFRDGYVFQCSRTTKPSLLYRVFSGSGDLKSRLVPLNRENSNTLFQEIRAFLAILRSSEHVCDEVL
jgi:hypothetical protein